MSTASVQAQIDLLNPIFVDLATSIDTVWILLTSFLIFWMQTGFLMLEAGIVRQISAQNIIMKNTLDILITAIAYWLIGYGFSFGDEGNGFISYSNFGLSSFTDYHLWYFYWVFLAASTTIISGAMAERTTISSFVIINVMLSGWVWPVVAHWVWSTQGWLSLFRDGGCCFDFVDFAGSTVVHVVGGLVGLVGAVALGPRTGRWDPERKGEFSPSNILWVVLGTFILWFGWFAFNAGSTLSATQGNIIIAGKIVVNVVIAPCFSGALIFALARFFEGHFSLVQLCNGMLSGLVAVTAGCPVIDPWGAMLIGVIDAPIFYGSYRLVQKLKIDDPLDAFPVHAVSGIWGTIAAGLFATQGGMSATYGLAPDTSYIGAFMPGTNGQLLGTQFLGVTVIVLWVLFWVVPLIYSLKFLGLLRVSAEEEEQGLDKARFGNLLNFFGPSSPESPSNILSMIGDSVPVLEGIKIVGDLGQGNFGKVKKGDWKGTFVAMKLLGDNENFANELTILVQNRHPHVLGFLGVFPTGKDNQDVYLVTEFMEAGDLRTLLIEEHEITNPDLLELSVQSASGIEYLHGRDIIHRDLACRNLLCSGNVKRGYTIKVADFGLSRNVDEYYTASSKQIPIRWTAPEALTTGKFTKSNDVWAFGVVLWEIYTRGGVPYAGLKNDEVINAVSEGLRMEAPANTPERVIYLMFSCWEPDPEQRPEIADITRILKDIQKEFKEMTTENNPEMLGLVNVQAKKEAVGGDFIDPSTPQVDN